MSEYRFKVGTTVMCNLGQQGWKLGRIIAHNYREDNWPKEDVAPYQVALEGDYTLIYVPQDSDNFCRKATEEDMNILSRNDALAELKTDLEQENKSSQISVKESNLCCTNDSFPLQYQSYRRGRCFCCNDCPKNWLHAELYSEHYRCADRNNVKITRHEVNLGDVKVGEQLDYKLDDSFPIKDGFLQAPTLPRLPPGIEFSDSGNLSGIVQFDPYRDSSYDVELLQ